MKEQMIGKNDRKIAFKLGDIPDCIGDQGLLRQVFANLLSNAIKYTRKNSQAIVEVGYCRHGTENVDAYFVKDNGSGFDMRHAKKLFGVFQRLYPEDGVEGTGIGLSIVQRVIQRHGGRIWAEAELGKGATFFFTLPEVEVGLSSLQT